MDTSKRRKKATFESEEELASVVVEKLKELGWEVYQEVQVFSTVADIVAVKDNKTWVIETKTTLNLDVLGQAYQWRHYANKVSIAVPAARRSRGRDFAYMVCNKLKIGIITVIHTGTFDGKHWWNIDRDFEHDSMEPALNKRLTDSLCELHKTWSRAGSKSGGHLTPFKLTCMGIKEYVEKHPGCSIKEVADNVETHYSNARAGICSAVRSDWVPGISAKMGKKGYELYPIKDERCINNE